MTETAQKAELGGIRRRLNEVDDFILEALATRQEIVREVARIKDAGGRPVRDAAREREILARLSSRATAAGLDDDYVKGLFREILEHSVSFQVREIQGGEHPAVAGSRLTVVYQGTDGAYSHLAARQYFGGRPGERSYRGCESFVEVAEAVESGVADVGFLPIENTTAGSINETYDVLANGDLSLIGEHVLRVEHCLVALEELPLEKIERISSHPQALAQCSRFLSNLEGCRVEAFTDTAMAARRVRDDGEPTRAAIASREAAERYGLTVLRSDIANQSGNFTRFVVAARKALFCDPRIESKTSLVITTKHREGALARCLDILARHGLNLTKLESRPRWNQPWEYLFYLDFEGSVASPEVRRALEALGEHTSTVKLLGSYPASPLAG